MQDQLETPAVLNHREWAVFIMSHQEKKKQARDRILIEATICPQDTPAPQDRRFQCSYLSRENHPGKDQVPGKVNIMSILRCGLKA